MVRAHMREAAHRGGAATLERLRNYCVCSGMENRISAFVRQCLHCVDSTAGELVPWPLGEGVHGSHPRQVLHFDYLHVGASKPMEQEGLNERDGFKYILVIMDDLSNFVRLEPAGACTAAVTAQHLV